MQKTVNECVGCRDLGKHCLGSVCPNRNVTKFFCDRCGIEMTDIYDVDGEELCEDCLKEMFKRE